MSAVAVTLNYRGAIRTVACVRSLLRNGCSRILVWDNSADDGSSAEEVRAAFRSDPRVEILVSDRNLGFAAGINAAVRHLLGTQRIGRLLIINNDAMLEDRALALLERAMDSDPFPVIVAPRIIEGQVVQDWMYYHRWVGLILRRPLAGAFPYLSGCCLLIDTDRVGARLFDEDFFMYGEDVELSFRMLRNGMPLGVEPAAIVRHVGSASSGRTTRFYEERLIRCHLLLANKLFSQPGARLLATVLHFAMIVLRGAWRSLLGRSWIPLIVVSKELRKLAAQPRQDYPRGP